MKLDHSYRSLFVLASLALAATACSNHAFSPPAGWVPAEEPVPLEEGKRAVSGGIGFGDVGLDAADLVGMNLRYREGLTDGLEIQAEGAAVIFDEDTDEFPAILSARVGLKGSFVSEFPHVGWTTGLGFGGSAGGLFTSLDAGVMAGWVNPYLTPWVAVSGVVSLPLTSNEIDLRNPGDEDPILDNPVTSYGVRFGVGLSAHLGDSDARMHLALANLRLWDIHGEDESVVGMTMAFDVPI